MTDRNSVRPNDGGEIRIGRSRAAARTFLAMSPAIRFQSEISLNCAV